MIEGATMARNFRRQGIKATKGGKPNPKYARSMIDGIPTPERLAKAQGHFVVGDDQQGTRIMTMRDNPLEKLLLKRVLSSTEYAALQKYHHHFFHAGLGSCVGSMDLNRVFASDPGSHSGMAKTEAQAFHRGKYRDARELLGHKTSIVVDNVVCNGTSPEVAGYAIGYASPSRAREAAEKHIKRAGDLLERHWGLR